MSGNATMSRMRTAVLSLGLLLILGAVAAQAGETGPAREVAPEAAPSGGTSGPVEGLRVHGHWTIEVRNPDGALVERRDFENALSIGVGDVHLVNVLARTRTAGTWTITANGSPQICEEPAGTPNICWLMEPSDPTPNVGNVFKTLTTSVVGGTLVLNGTATAQRDGQITAVSTRDNHCASSIAPASCTGGNTAGSAGITSTALGTPVSVLTGQQVQVRVVISFS
jgi:hypothetical protein